MNLESFVFTSNDRRPPFGSALAVLERAGRVGLFPSKRASYSLRAAQVGQRLAQDQQGPSVPLISTLLEHWA